MVTIKLTDGYFIEKSGLDYVLKREYVTEKKGNNPGGKLTVKDIGYYGKNLEHALKDYLSLIQSEATYGVIFSSMSDYIRTIRDINDLTVKQIIASQNLNTW